MTITLVLRFLIILLAMLISGVFGYMLARRRADDRSAVQVSVLSAEIAKMRRRASSAEAGATAAHARLSRERRRQRRL